MVTYELKQNAYNRNKDDFIYTALASVILHNKK